MASPRGRGPRTRGILRGLGRLVVLVGLGFGLGLAIGLVTEEPALLYGHLRGASESVPLAESQRILDVPNPPVGVVASDTRSGARGTEVAARPDPSPRGPAVVAAGGSQPKAPAELPKVSAPRPVVTSAAVAPRNAVAQPQPQPQPHPQPSPQRRAETGRDWAIQVGAFSDEATAQRLVDTLEAKNYPVAVVASSGAAQRWRVRVQPVRGEDRARGMADRLKREERLPTWMIPMEADSR
jgi:cell division septation protein DedD